MTTSLPALAMGYLFAGGVGGVDPFPSSIFLSHDKVIAEIKKK